MNPKDNPQNWASCGMLLHPFFISTQMKMNQLTSFSWIKANGEPDLPSQKRLEFLVSGTPAGTWTGKVEQYKLDILPDDEKGLNLKLPLMFQYKYDSTVINTSVCQDMLAVKTHQEAVFINKLNKPSDITKLKFPEQSKQKTYNKTLAWRSDRQAIIAASNSKSICIWDVTTQKCRSTIQYYKKDITDIIWLNQKYFASASLGGNILLWSMNQAKPICGFSDSNDLDPLASTSLSLAKKGSIDEAIILSATDRVITLLQRGTKSKIQFRGQHNSQIMKVQYQGVACKQRLFAALDKNGRIVLYDRNGKQSVYNNPQFQMKCVNFHCMNGFYGSISSKYLTIWTPVSNRCLHRNTIKR